MILIPSGMAESDGGSAETVVLTDPLIPRHPRQAFGQAHTAMFIAPRPVTGSGRLADSYERAVSNGCAREVSTDSRQGTVRIARIVPRSPMPHPIRHGAGSI